jgi:hypothetical protein
MSTLIAINMNHYCAILKLIVLVAGWEKGLGDEGLSILFLKSLSRFELIPCVFSIINKKGKFQKTLLRID